MNSSIKKLLYWSPRILAILFAVFTSIFALDVFNEQSGLFETLSALLIHLLPTIIIGATLLAGWKWEWIGGILFSVYSIAYIYSAWGRFPASVYFVICLPMLAVSILFFINWYFREELKTK